MRPDKQIELFQVALDDLTYVLDMGMDEQPTPQELRRVSGALQRLLLPGRGDNLLRKAARQIDHPSITIFSHHHELALQYLEDGQIIFFQNGGMALWGLEFLGLVSGPAESSGGDVYHDVQIKGLDQDAFLDQIVLGFYK
jgi:hypothetical protein